MASFDLLGSETDTTDESVKTTTLNTNPEIKKRKDSKTESRQKTEIEEEYSHIVLYLLELKHLSNEGNFIEYENVMRKIFRG